MIRKNHPLVLITFVAALTASATLSAMEKPTIRVTDLQITDKKLGTINYALESLEHWLTKMQPGDKNYANKLNKDLMKQMKSLQRVKDADQSQVQAVENYINQLSDYLASVQSATNEPEPQPTGTNQHASTVANTIDIALYTRKLNSLKRRVDDPDTPGMELAAELQKLVGEMGQYPESTDTDYRVLMAEMTHVAQQISLRNPNIGMTREQARDYIQKKTEQYRDFLPAINFGARGEIEPQSVDEYIAALKATDGARMEDLPRLKNIVQATGEGKSLLKHLETGIIKDIQRSAQIFDQQMKHHVNYVHGLLSTLAELDPVKNAYAFNNEDKRKKNEHQFQITSNALEQAARVEAVLGAGQVFTETKQQFDANLKTWRSHFASAVAGYELPTDIGNEELRVIAESVLKTEKYGITGWEKIIVNADLRSQETIEHKVINRGLETIIRQWQEYQVTTVEQENGKYYAYFNTLRNFSRAPRTTPVNQWILAKRIKSSEVSQSKLH